MNVLLVWSRPANDEESSVVPRRDVSFLRQLAAQDVSGRLRCGDEADFVTKSCDR